MVWFVSVKGMLNKGDKQIIIDYLIWPFFLFFLPLSLSQVDPNKLSENDNADLASNRYALLLVLTNLFNHIKKSADIMPGYVRHSHTQKEVILGISQEIFPRLDGGFLLLLLLTVIIFCACTSMYTEPYSMYCTW